jgi:hypothetical protein
VNEYENLMQPRSAKTKQDLMTAINNIRRMVRKECLGINDQIPSIEVAI